MIDFLRDMPFYQVQILLALLVIVIAVKKSFELFIINNEKHLKAGDFGINAIPVISGMMIFVAFFVLLYCTYIGMQPLTHVNDITPRIVWGGIHVALTQFVFTLHFFIVALTIWFIIRTRYNYLIRKSRKRV